MNSKQIHAKARLYIFMFVCMCVCVCLKVQTNNNKIINMIESEIAHHYLQYIPHFIHNINYPYPLGLVSLFDFPSLVF